MAETTDINNIQGHNSIRILGERNQSDSLEENQIREKPKMLQPVLQMNQNCNQSTDKENCPNSELESNTNTPRSTEKGQQSPSGITRQRSGCQWLQDNGEKMQKKSAEKQGPHSIPGKRKRPSKSKQLKIGDYQRQQTSSEKGLKTRTQRTSCPEEETAGLERKDSAKTYSDCKMTNEQKPTSDQVTLSFKWVGKPDKYITINADPHETIIDTLKKSVNFTEKYKDSSYLIIWARHLNAIINQSAPCGALGKKENLDLSQLTLKKKNIKLIATPPYQNGTGGLFFKVNNQGKTEGGAGRKILQYRKPRSHTLPLAVFGYGEQTIEEALRNDKRFDNTNLLSLEGTKGNTYMLTVKLSQLPEDTYNITVSPKAKPGDINENTLPHEEVTESRSTPSTNPTSDDQGKFAATEPPKTIEEIFVENFSNFVSANGGSNKAWEIITQECDNNFLKSPLMTGPLRDLMGYIDCVAMILVTDGNTVNQGTCFHLYKCMFLTCYHVVKDLLNTNSCYKAEVIFRYDYPNQIHNLNPRSMEIISHSEEHDYAFIRVKISPCPEGLLQYLGPPPEDGVVSIIGHPGNQCKQIDLCSVINVLKDLKITEKFDNYPSIVHCISLYQFAKIRNPGLTTYKTSLYEGASGAPVFTEHGKLVSMHRAGYSVPAPMKKKHVIEFGSSIADILIYGSVEIKALRLELKEMVKKNGPLKVYIENRQFPADMHPIIEEILLDTASNNSISEVSLMEVS
ncbi:serine protease FAM111A-like isoform X2 [Mixophyes fleayi]|uniref:serine protease FAM111A-like isoform X2 n=1 Tax=Mixophyes fleayi TaxID=3061075 RepID=UPI003F4D9A18